MKRHKKAKQTSLVRRSPRLLGAGVLLALALLAVGLVVAVSKQKSSAKDLNSEATRNQMTNGARILSQNTRSDTQTAQIKPLTQEEAQRLASALKELANQSTAGLKAVHYPDGTVSMDLEGRFQNVALARKNEDGSVSQSCVDNPQAGAAFFGIDPQLVGIKTKTGAAAAPSTSPANK